jgi:hypothetical protein
MGMAVTVLSEPQSETCVVVAVLDDVLGSIILKLGQPHQMFVEQR